MNDDDKINKTTLMTTTATLPAMAGSFDDQTDDGRDRLIQGTILACVDGIWAARDESEHPPKLIAMQTAQAVQHWKDGRPVPGETVTTRPLPDVDYLNSQIPVDQWEEGFDGEPRPPWQHQHIAYLLDPETFATYTFINSTYGAMLAVSDLKEQVRMHRCTMAIALASRQQGAQAAARKLDSLIAGTDADQRMRGTLRYHGASTGRWSGSRFQPQNLKKPKTKDLDAAIDAIRSGDLRRVRGLGAPLAIVGDASRAMICAAPGHVMIGADFSAIESRVLAWLAGETWKLDTYRKYDETGDPALEPYCQTASRILQRAVTPADEVGRGIGKIADLAFGYGGSLGAWRKFDNSKNYNDEQIKNFCAKWRTQHAATVNFWRALESMLRRAISTKQRVTLKNLAAEMVNDALYLTLPSGRRLAYPGARLEPGKYQGTVQIVFKDNKGGWNDVRGWSGVFVENVVSAISRDLLAAAMQRLEAGGYPIVLHIHDESVAEVPEGHGSIDEFLALMTALPDWAAGLPVVAKAWSGTRYTKSAPTAPPTAPTAMTAQTEMNSESDSADAENRELTTTLAVVENAAATAIPEKIKSDEASNNTNSGGGDAQHRCDVQMRNKLAVTGTSIAPINEADHGVVPLADLIGQPLNHDRKILCPFHDDRTPSLHIYNDHFKCFVCQAHGDAIDWLMMIEGKSRAEAEHILRTWDGPLVRPRSVHKDNKSALAFASQIWEKAEPIGSTSAIRYLADVRGIDTDALPTDNAALRFHDNCPFGPGVRVPCLVALYRDVISDAPAGIHRIALTPDVFAGGKVRRKMLGPWPTPRAIKLWPATDQLFFGEGIETVLAAATRVQYRGTLMRPAWAAGSAGNISKFPVIAGVKELILLVDRDPEGARCADACRLTWRKAGRKVARLQPDCEGTDFNDLVLMRTRAG
jgi:hypothetical protein